MNLRVWSVRRFQSIGSYFSSKPAALRDLIAIVLFALMVVIVTTQFDIFNKLISLLYRYDTWQIDEMSTLALYLLVAFAVYAWRRHREFVSEVKRRERAEAEQARLLPKLEQALADVSTLKKLLPICSSCKKVRDDKGYWNQIEVYIETEFHTRLDGGICPDCARRLYRRRTDGLKSPSPM